MYDLGGAVSGLSDWGGGRPGLVQALLGAQTLPPLTFHHGITNLLFNNILPFPPPCLLLYEQTEGRTVLGILARFFGQTIHKIRQLTKNASSNLTFLDKLRETNKQETRYYERYL
jgi:hypothetical protein